MEQVKIRIPYDFISHKVHLSWKEILFGIKEELFSPPDVIDFATDLLIKGIDNNAILEIALKRRDEPIIHIVSQLAFEEEQEDITDIRRLWAFLALAWIYEHYREYSGEPYDLVELLYSDLDYPIQLVPLIGYMPSNKTHLLNSSSDFNNFFEIWKNYLLTEENYFKSRNQPEY
ncbi:DUF2247 family protein [Myxococcota bacterium]|nr:DUF2247 family protein [Myxococcota bacterium]MBU1380582.1 DUF2247 family protein [Myxococcota bacterium]MBU1497160.1 DUF2247 family protein [Myxococcota bacterium]